MDTEPGVVLPNKNILCQGVIEPAFVLQYLQNESTEQLDPRSDLLSKRTDYTVIEAVVGEDAVRKFIAHKEQIDLALLDVIMPNKNGKETCRDIQKDI